MDGLSVINVELTSRCNKVCGFCGRRRIEKEFPKLVNWGDIDYELVKSISQQIPKGIVIQFHNNGEPLLYPRFGEAVALFKNQIKCVDTNGKLLMEKADEIIDNLDTITISAFRDDPEADEQYHLLRLFLNKKERRKPNVIVRCLGEMDTTRYEILGCIIARRVLHSPMGSFNYQKRPTIPEIGICLDLLSHLCIDRFGNVSPCVRFDSLGLNILANANETSLSEIWGGSKRKGYLRHHIAGNRSQIGLCSKCEFWGIPTGW